MTTDRFSYRCVLVAVTLLACPRLAAAEPGAMSKHHQARIHGKILDYTAMYDRFEVLEPGGKTGATVTTISYLKDGTNTQRPVVFAFNGGPGSSSLPLNVGLLGPKRLDLPADPSAPIPAHVPMVANDDSILDAADIVLIDPVGTGYSQLLDPTARGYFYSVPGDAQSVTDAIEAWVRAHGRQGAPKYVLGESYGAQRAVHVGANLLKTPDAGTFEGIILLSQSLPIVDTVQRRSNIVGQVVGMPTLAATAWYHKLAGQGSSLTDFVEEASLFAQTEWLPALLAGSQMPGDARQRVAARLSHYTGVSQDYLLSHDLYLTKETYRRIALGDRGLILGLYDTRYTGPLEGDRDPARLVEEAIAAARQDVFQDEFGIPAPDYDQHAKGERVRDTPWIYVKQPFAPTDGDTYLQIDYVGDLIRVMKDQPHLRVMLGGGWYDTAASAGADDYLMSRPGLDLSRISARHYLGGHMFYTVPESRIAFATAMREFITAVH